MTPAGTSPGGNGTGLAFEDSDESLDRLVRPHGWQNPQPRGLYDLVVIGGGTAGLVSAVGAAGLGARVALVERQRLGGDCLNTGCVPSKAILRTARAVGEIRRALDFGIHVGHVGLSPDSAHRRQEHVRTITVPLAEVDRGVLDDETEGFLRVHHRRGRIVGCTIVSSQAGDLIGLAGNLIGRRARMAEPSSTIFPYPTQAEAYRKAGDAYRRTLVTPRVRRAFERYFALARW